MNIPKRKSDNNNNIEYKNNSDSEYNIKIYNSVFNNIYLKKIILNHLNKYNILYNNIKFNSHEQWVQFKYKEYLNRITLDYKINDDLIQLPKNIKHVELVMKNDTASINDLCIHYEIPETLQQIIIKHLIDAIDYLNSTPNHIESIKLVTGVFRSEFSAINSDILSKVVSLKIEEINHKYQVKLNKILPSVTDLSIDSQSSTILKKDIVSRNLKQLCLNNVKSIENGILMKSLSNAILINCSPSIINQIISNKLVKLEFKHEFDACFDSGFKFQETLQELTIQCFSFSGNLPSNLKSFDLKTFKFKDTIIFPSSLESINISITDRKNKEVFKNKESVPSNLKLLKFPCSSIVDNKGQSILPDKLEKLHFNYHFNQILQVNQLPSSLTYLDLGFSYRQVININVLPSSLKTLVLGDMYTEIINPSAIPQQLKLLVIKNLDYNHPIHLTVSTHPNILINCYNIKSYYNPSNTSIRKLRLPNNFNSSLSALQLQDKSSLEYLHLGKVFRLPIELSDLPINNNIKTLKLSYEYNQTFNLEHFQNLETIILTQYSKAKITTTTSITNPPEITYNNYNLKNIIVPPNNNQFIINLNINFYQFVKIK